jgi:mannose-6-phosphate isomerase
MEESIYPLKFRPIFKEKIWGGQKIKTILNKDFGLSCNCGESWELSGIEGDVSEVAEGFLEDNTLNDLTEIYMYDLVGDKVYQKYGLGFPLLIKFIDANDDLSVQVHPDDLLAMKRYNLNGKTELWYIMDADPGAGLYVGFKKGVTKNDYLKAVGEGTIDKMLEFYPAKRGDIFFIPGGTVHAIGKGILLAEIQESSDITYRIFDWNRTDEHGHSRELHCEDALDAIHFEDKTEYKINFEEKFNSTTKIFRNDYFNLNLLSFDKPLQKVFVNIDSFVIYIVVEGEVHFMYNNSLTVAKKGEILLKPASLEDLNLIPVLASKVLEVYVD